MSSTTRRAIRSASSAALLAPLLLCAIATSHARAEELLPFLLNWSEAATAKIKSYSFTVETEYENVVRNRPATTSTGEIKRRGQHLFAFNKSSVRGPFGPMEHRAVVNDEYAAYWPRGNPIAYRVDHESPAKIDANTAGHLKGATPFDPFPHCFGNADLPFRAAIAQHEETKWDAVESKDATGRLVYHVRCFMPRTEDPTKPDAIWVVDPDKNFLSTEHLAYAPAGHLFIRHSATLKELSPGVWFPVEHAETHYASDPAPNTVTSRRRVVLRDIKLNPDLPDEQFQLDALGLKDVPNIRVLRTHVDGTKVTYVYHEGPLIPEKEAQALRRRER